MKQIVRVVKKNGANIYYRVKSIAIVTDVFVDHLDWPPDISRMSFLFDEQIENEYELINRNISDKYSARLTYCADKSNLTVPELKDGGEDIGIKTLNNLSEIREVYLRTVHKVFKENWPNKLSGDRLKFSEKVAREHLFLEKSVCLARNKETVGIATFVNLTDYLGCPVDCVNWVWLDKSLSIPERIKAQSLIVYWLKKVAGEKINCYIDSFNWRSQRFFKRIGFKPACLNIEKHS